MHMHFASQFILHISSSCNALSPLVCVGRGYAVVTFQTWGGLQNGASLHFARLGGFLAVISMSLRICGMRN